MTVNAASPRPVWYTPAVIVTAACLISLISFGTRTIFGLFLEPMTTARGWERETFALALAIQNIVWGFGAPIAGILVDRWGPTVVMITGAVLYCVGTIGMATVESGQLLFLFAGVVAGIGIALTSFSLALASIAQVVSPERRSLALGFGTASGTMGQVLLSPLGQFMIVSYGWQTALFVFAGIVLLILPLSLLLPKPGSGTASNEPVDPNKNPFSALREASQHQGFILLTIGFFVCGFHVSFLAVHFPAYITDLGMGPEVVALAFMLIGIVNIIFSFLAGAAGQRYPKKSILSMIYFARAVVILALLFAPKTPLTIYVFSISLGMLWLSTVPLTSAIVAQVFGVRYMATLFGVVFFGHQVGSFFGIWLGGLAFDAYGSYDLVWWISVGLGVAAGLIHLPINERPLARLAPAPNG